jgi:hypothetical protein
MLGSNGKAIERTGFYDFEICELYENYGVVVRSKLYLADETIENSFLVSLKFCVLYVQSTAHQTVQSGHWIALISRVLGLISEVYSDKCCTVYLQ